MGTEAIFRNIGNQDFDFGEQGNKFIDLFQGNKGTGTPLGGPHSCMFEVLIHCPHFVSILES